MTLLWERRGVGEGSGAGRNTTEEGTLSSEGELCAKSALCVVSVGGEGEGVQLGAVQCSAAGADAGRARACVDGGGDDDDDADGRQQGDVQMGGLG